MKAPRGSQRLPHAEQAARLDSWNYLLARCQELCFGDWVQAASRALAQAAGMDSDLGAALEALLSAAARALSSYNSSSCYLPIAEAHSAREALDHDCALAVHRLLRSQAAKSKAAAEAKQTARKKR